MFDTDDKLLGKIILKIALILILCVVKTDGKFYPQIFLGDEMYIKQTCQKRTF